MQPLETLSGIPGVQLTVGWLNHASIFDHPCKIQWIKQHGQSIIHLNVELYNKSCERLKLRDFSEAAAPVRSIDLKIRHSYGSVLELSDLDTVAGSLHQLSCTAEPQPRAKLKGARALMNMSQRTSLLLAREDFGNEEPWSMLAKVTSLQRLSLSVFCSGDPSPVSALTGLTYLELYSCMRGAPGPDPFSFSSLQPLSTLQQLEVLYLGHYACAATSLEGLAELSNLKDLKIDFDDPFMDFGHRLTSLEGISPGLKELHLGGFDSLAGVEGCTCIEKLYLDGCAIPSLQPLKVLSSLRELEVYGEVTSLQSLESSSLQSLRLSWCDSLSHLSGVDNLSALTSFDMSWCAVTSLQPLCQLGSKLLKLRVFACDRVQEETLELPHVQPTADVNVCSASVREVVLAGAVRREVGRERLRPF
jgi:hypothetical protein